MITMKSTTLAAAVILLLATVVPTNNANSNSVESDMQRWEDSSWNTYKKAASAKLVARLWDQKKCLDNYGQKDCFFSVGEVTISIYGVGQRAALISSTDDDDKSGYYVATTPNHLCVIVKQVWDKGSYPLAFIHPMTGAVHTKWYPDCLRKSDAEQSP